MTWPFALGKNLLAHTIDNRQATTPSYIRNYPTSAKKKLASAGPEAKYLLYVKIDVVFIQVGHQDNLMIDNLFMALSNPIWD